MRYPIGIQTFEEVRIEGYVYVDKSRLVYELTHDYKYVFLSRPRRFGKSLLLSTIKSYFQGKCELFEGLEINKLEKDWTAHPVIYLDLVSGLFNSSGNLRKHLDFQLSILEEKYGSNPKEQTISDRFAGIVRRAHEMNGKRVVILIDEYDKPLLDTLDNEECQEEYRFELRALYAVLKSQDQHIRFAMLTGVTKFGHVSVFSGLNNITDISFLDKYASICGITNEEIHTYFDEPLQEMAKGYGISVDEMSERLRIMYDGYRFTKSCVKVFNPFSLLNAFAQKELGSYWFASGTPQYLAKLLTMHHYEVSSLEGVTADLNSLSNIDTCSSDPIPVIYQSGYLTIKNYDAEVEEFTLGFPNEEVRKSFMQYLMPFYLDRYDATTRFDINNFKREIIKGEPQSFMSRVKSLTADISYKILVNCENDFHNLLFMLFTLASSRPIVERQTSDGSIDMVVETEKFVYVMEFKIDSSAQAAIDQIESKAYTLSWDVDHRRVFKIGANFSTTERRLTECIVL